MYRAIPQEPAHNQGMNSSNMIRASLASSRRDHPASRRGLDVWYQTSSNSLPVQPLWLRRAPSAGCLPSISRAPLPPTDVEPDFFAPSLPDTHDHCCFPKDFPPLPPSNPAPNSRNHGRRSTIHARGPLPLTIHGPPTRELPPLPAPRVRDNRRHCRIGMQSPVSMLQDSVPPGTVSTGPPSSSSSLSSSSIATPSCQNSDSESDIFDLQLPSHFQFPQPPPLSPLLRRMQSSPGFNHATFPSVEDLARRKRNVFLSQQQAEPIVRTREGGLSSGSRVTTSDSNMVKEDEDFSWEASTPPLSTDEDYGSPQFVSITSVPQTERRTSSTLLSSILNQEPDDPPSALLPLIEEDGSPTSSLSIGIPAAKDSTLGHRTSMRYMDKVLRKVASMKDPSYRGSRWEVDPTQETPERFSALSRLECSMEKLRAFNPAPDSQLVSASPSRPRHVRSSSTGSAIVSPRSTRFPSSNPTNAVPPSATARPFPRHRFHQSEAIANPGRLAQGSHAQNNSRAPTRTGQNLGPAFNHRPTRSHAVMSEYHYPRKLQKERMGVQPACFMDVTITPEQELKRVDSFKRVRKMISRASISLAGWGKGLNRKKSCSNLRA